jgi:hypothetical protein
MKIAVFDSWQYKFTAPVIAHWQAQGHEVRAGLYWGPEIVEWADACLFYPCDNNLIQASKKSEKPPGTRIIVEAVDIDIYAGHPGAVNWEYVDALVVMAQHTLDLLRTKTKLRPGLPVHIVPGGVDLDRFTLRTGPRGYNVAWMGRLWIAKNVFGALQIFHQLMRADPAHPWRLFCLGHGYDPHWWRVHVESYLKANVALAQKVEFVNRVEDVNEWLDDKDFLLQTSFKEAFGYVIGEAAAKGILPVIQNTNGMRDIWPTQWVFDTHAQAVEIMKMRAGYDRQEIRGVIENHYPLKNRLAALDALLF